MTAPQAFLVTDLGEAAPKGFQEPVRLYEVVWETSR